MKNGDNQVLHVKIPFEIYVKLKRQAKREMRSVHSLVVYALAKFAEKIGTGK